MGKYSSNTCFLATKNVSSIHVNRCYRILLSIDEATCVWSLRLRLSWAAMDSGPTCTVADLVNFLQTSVQEQKKRVPNFNGTIIMLKCQRCIRQQSPLCNLIIFRVGMVCFRHLIYLLEFVYIIKMAASIL